MIPINRWEKPKYTPKPKAGGYDAPYIFFFYIFIVAIPIFIVGMVLRFKRFRIEIERGQNANQSSADLSASEFNRLIAEAIEKGDVPLSERRVQLEAAQRQFMHQPIPQEEVGRSIGKNQNPLKQT
ncbi:MAG: hypothetical protein J0L94_13135 [Rhodothermia bacterium]|nr:hypothetical protein [Rhodothermia bacterium]